MNSIRVSLTISMIVLCLLAFLLPAIAMAEILEPPSPEEEWNPPPPTEERPMYAQQLTTVGTSASVPGAGALTIELLDATLRVRREFYVGERIIMRFVSPFNSFYVFLYEWYPPGTVPRGHWLIWGAGPYRTGAGAVIHIGYFYPEPNEPEGQHVWKLWLYDPTTGSWASGIIRWNYFSFPRACISRVDYPQELIVGRSYDLKVYVQNLGEIDYTYAVEVEGYGVTFSSRRLEIRVQSKATVEVLLPFSVTASGALNVKVSLYGDNTLIDSKTISMASKLLKPGPMSAGDIAPTVLKEGEEASLVLTFINRGEGEARQIFARVEAPGFMLVSGVDTSPNVPSGGSGRVTFTLRPLEGGRKTVKFTITYSDIAGNTYSDIIETSVLVLVKLNVHSESTDGRLLQVNIDIDGRKYTSFSDWIDPTRSLSLEAPQIIEEGRTRYVFERWSDGATAASRTITLSKSATIAAVYRVEYYVSLTSPFGEVKGGGWYPKDSTATIRVEPSQLGFGVKKVFDHWEDEKGRIVSRSPEFSLIVDEPLNLKAVWRDDYTDVILLAVTLAAVALLILYLKRKPAPPPPPPPPPT
ncbi:MAG: hypothetical protein QXU69_08660 [Thermofilaceae archaeon]